MSLIQRLRDAVGGAAVLTDPDATEGYARDMMPLAPAGRPLAVVLPADTAEVQACVRACAEADVPVVPRGAGSGLTGGANAVDGCVVLVTTRMDRILELDADNRLAVVQPGVVNRTLRDAAAAHGLFYPPDPSSLEWCTLGGNLATDAGGLCCGKYGVTSDAVLGLEVVLADGSLLTTGRRTVKGVAGYDLTRLFVGSEGTLGIIAKATLKLRPLPAAPGTIVAAFDSVERAGEAVNRVVRAGLVPSLMEIMDATSLRASAEYLRADLGAGDSGALLLCQSDAGGEPASAELNAMERLFKATGAQWTHATTDPAEGGLLLRARRVSLPALEARGACMTEDVAVPRTRIAELMAGCEEIGAQAGLTVAVVGHAGDGNMHPTVLYDGASAEQYARARGAFDAILALALSLGGTVTGEHGIGKLKTEWLERELGPVSMRVHRQLKDALDPAGLFNPGAMFARRRPAGGPTP
ncbi:FAD-binding oxidoreductase [Streptomyces sp. IMTB 2501]|uniref:FAD-binding oxidoreductase n=1 Tax=Streptomyces sp. IMTB 2501 TaxID=1776340 RepID=UPI00096C9ECC|nr:FAD-linked oxidase C-terminal domain-containing protein [Streptomyces sp. IMTB 2501]OLZ66441.1 FAD-binding oxidoreductase [Streptomyces sp. IMTB 2501]